MVSFILTLTEWREGALESELNVARDGWKITKATGLKAAKTAREKIASRRQRNRGWSVG